MSPTVLDLLENFKEACTHIKSKAALIRAPAGSVGHCVALKNGRPVAWGMLRTVADTFMASQRRRERCMTGDTPPIYEVIDQKSI